MSELHTLLELLGEDATLALIEAYGGTRVGVPQTAPKEHPLRTLLGEADFARLMKGFGGAEISVPLARRWRVKIYAGKKLRRKEIALRAGYTESAVSRILNGEKRQPGQLVLAFEKEQQR